MRWSAGKSLSRVMPATLGHGFAQPVANGRMPDVRRSRKSAIKQDYGTATFFSSDECRTRVEPGFSAGLEQMPDLAKEIEALWFLWAGVLNFTNHVAVGLGKTV